jgi:hypothetical protein
VLIFRRCFFLQDLRLRRRPPTVTKSTGNDETLRHEKTEEPKGQNIALGIDATKATSTSNKKMDEHGFFRHIGSGELDDKEVDELEKKGKAMGYGPRAMLFGEEHQSLSYKREYCKQGHGKSKVIGYCWGPSASEGPQRHNLTMFSKYASRYLRNQVANIQKRGQDEAWLK